MEFIPFEATTRKFGIDLLFVQYWLDAEVKQLLPPSALTRSPWSRSAAQDDPLAAGPNARAIVTKLSFLMIGLRCRFRAAAAVLTAHDRSLQTHE